jgi:hypothetical protein
VLAEDRVEEDCDLFFKCHGATVHGDRARRNLPSPYVSRARRSGPFVRRLT